MSTPKLSEDDAHIKVVTVRLKLENWIEFLWDEDLRNFKELIVPLCSTLFRPWVKYFIKLWLPLSKNGHWLMGLYRKKSNPDSKVQDILDVTLFK